jgi:anti-sigma-K factor RskA
VTDPEIDALLGAYALDALDDDERAQVEAYLVANPVARNEVDEMRESAASLALAPVDEAIAPPELWDRIATTIADEPRNVVPLRAERRSRSAVWLGAIAAALIAVIAIAATVVSVNNNGSSNTGNLAAAFDKARGEAGAREVALTGENGATLAHAVLLPDGRGYLRNDGMQPLPTDKTYQLWAVTDSTPKPIVISAGALGPDPHTVAFHTDGPVNTLGVTVEQAPGVVASQQPMYAQATVS